MEEVQYGEQDVLLSVPGDGGMRRMYKIRCLRKGAPYGRFTGYAGVGDKRAFRSGGTHAGGESERSGRGKQPGGGKPLYHDY